VKHAVQKEVAGVMEEINAIDQSGIIPNTKITLEYDRQRYSPE
jgi:hypothetical protein